MAQGRKVLRIWGARAANRALRQWIHWRGEHRVAMAMIRRTDFAFVNTTVRAGFNSWRAVAGELAGRDQLMTRVAMVFLNKELAGALRAWAETATTWRVEGGRLQSAVLRWGTAGVGSAWNTWVFMCGQRAKVVRAILCLLNMQLSRALNTWRALAEDVAETLQRLRGAIQLLQGHGTWRAWLRWCQRWRQDSHLERIFTQVLGALAHVSLPVALRCALGCAYPSHNHYPNTPPGLTTCALKLPTSPGPSSPHSQSHARRAFTSWTSLLAYDAAMLRRACKAMANLQLATAYRTWLANARSSAEGWHNAARALAGFRHRHVLSGLNSWKELVHEQHVMSVSVRVLRSCSLRRAYNSWVELLHQPPDPLLRSVAHLCHQELSRAWVTWATEAAERLIMIGALAALQQRELRWALNTWGSWHADRVAAAEVAAVALVQMSKLRCRANHWRELTSNARLVRQASVSAASRSLSRGFREWHGKAQKISEALATLRSAAARFSVDGRRLASAFAAWTPLIEERRQLKRAAQALLNVSLRRALTTWMGAAETAGEMHERMARVLRVLSPAGRSLRRAFNQLSEAGAEFALLRRVAAVLLNREVHRALLSWRGLGEQAVRLRAAAAAWLEPSLRYAFTIWCQTPPHPATIVLGRWLQLPMSRAFTTWCDAYTIDALGQRSVAHWLNRELAAAVNGWVEYIALLGVIRRTFACMRAVGLRHALLVWHAGATQLSGASGRLERAARHLLNRRLAVAMTTWAAETAERLLMLSSLAALLRRNARRALNTWADWAVEQAAVDDGVATALAVMRDSELRRSLAQWAEMSAARAAAVEAMTVAVAYLTDARTPAFMRWVETATGCAATLRTIQRFGLRMIAGRALRVWAAMANARAHLCVLLGKSQPMRWQLRHAVRRWRPLARDAPALRRAVSKCAVLRAVAAFSALDRLRNYQRLLRFGASAHLHRASRRGLNTWVERAHESARLATLVSGLSADGRLMRRAWNGWSAQLVERTVERRAATAFRRRLRAALNTWRCVPPVIEIARRALSFLAHQSLSRAWLSWCDGAERQRCLRRALSHFVGVGLVRAFNSWEAYLVARARQRECSQRLISYASAAAFRTWASVVEVQLERRGVMAAAAMRLVSPLVSQAFSSWAAWTGTLLGQLEQQRSAVAAFTSAGARAAYNSWVGHLEERERLQRGVSGFLHTGSKRRAFMSWADDVAQRAHLELTTFTFGVVVSGVARAYLTWRNLHAAQRVFARCMAHWECSELTRGWYALARFAVHHLKCHQLLFAIANQLAVRSLRTWRHVTLALLRVRGALLSLQRTKARRALNSWARVTEDEGAKQSRLARMCATLRQLAGGHRTLRAFNSWRAALASARHNVDTLRLLLEKRRRRPLCAVWRRWTATRLACLWLASGDAHHLRRAHGAAFRSWLRKVARVRRARLLDWPVRECRLLKALWRWVGCREATIHRRTIIAAAETFAYGVSRSAALRLWRRGAAALKPQRRAVAHWRRAPVAKALRKLRAVQAWRARLRLEISRWLSRALSAALRTWLEHITRRRGLIRPAAAFAKPPHRRALNTWTAFAQGRRRLQRLVRSFMGPRRNYFRLWAAVVERAQQRLHAVPVNPASVRMIKPLTWRECCSWLLTIGIQVSSSPPTLLRTLKSGSVYQVRLMSNPARRFDPPLPACPPGSPSKGQPLRKATHLHRPPPVSEHAARSFPGAPSPCRPHALMQRLHQSAPPPSTLRVWSASS